MNLNKATNEIFEREFIFPPSSLLTHPSNFSKYPRSYCIIESAFKLEDQNSEEEKKLNRRTRKSTLKTRVQILIFCFFKH